jgi:O-methyltransferase
MPQTLLAPKAFIRRTVQGAARSFGFELKRIAKTDWQIKSLVNDVPHEPIRTTSTYAPWNNDADFLGTFQDIQGFSLVDLYRCHELWALTGQAARLDGDVIEIGVWRGGTGALIARRLSMLAPDRVIYLCDTFSGVTGAGKHDTRYKGGEHADTTMDIVQRLLDHMMLKNARIVQGIFPHETGDQIHSSKLALAHIDVDVYNSAKWCFDWVWPRLVSGGVVVFDDYGFHGCEGVTRMVNAITPRNAVIIYNINGHAVVVKTQ